MPVFFVAGTALVGFPLAIIVGVLAAHASAPPPLEIPVASEAEDPADVAAKDDAAAISLGIKRFYQQNLQGGIAAPPVTFSHGTYTLGPVVNGPNTWEWPPISASDGVSLGGQNGHSEDTWCVWLIADAGTVKNWQATADGVTEGTCGV